MCPFRGAYKDVSDSRNKLPLLLIYLEKYAFREYTLLRGFGTNSSGDYLGVSTHTEGPS